MHHPGHGERRDGRREGGRPRPDEGREAAPHGVVHGGPEYAADHEVPPPAPEVLQRGREVGLVELPLEVEP